MSKKHRSGVVGQQPAKRGPVRAEPDRGLANDPRARIGVLVIVLILASIVVIGADLAFSAITGQGNPASTASSTAVVTTHPAITWTNVTADQLAGMLTHKDFTLVNVKTPYMGEIDGTDSYIPYDQIAARASDLPSDKGAKILVYCRSGAESAVAAQTLLDLGYTNVWNLTGGMNAWTGSGRVLVQKNR